VAVADGLAARVVAAGRRCSLTKSVLAEWARRGTPRQVEYLAGYLEAECASREASKRANLLRRCALPQAKNFDGYEWGQIEWPDGFGRDDPLSLSFLDGREDLVLMGDVGTGKAHMAEALCALACQRARPARFFTASSLVMRLRRARDDGRLDRELAQLGGAELLVIDELGFLPLDADGARLLFRVVSEVYETQSAVFATNLEFSRWGPVFRGRPDGRGRDRPRRAPREAPAVSRRVLPRQARAGAVRVAQKACPERVGELLRNW
jgi:DNA replication protein DnaC